MISSLVPHPPCLVTDHGSVFSAEVLFDLEINEKADLGTATMFSFSSHSTDHILTVALKKNHNLGGGGGCTK